MEAWEKIEGLLRPRRAARRDGAYYVDRQPDWIRRQDETITIEDLRLAHRHQAIDIVLPGAEAAVQASDSGELTYVVPVTLLAKGAPRPNLSIRDEDGNALPPLTRQENALLSERALLAAIEDARHRPTDEIKKVIHELAFEFYDLKKTRKAHTLFVALAEEKGPSGRVHAASPAFPHLKQASLDLVTHSTVWVQLTGVPGQRRLIRVEYDVNTRRPRLFGRREPGDPSPRSFGARLFSRFSTAMGWAAVDYYVLDPRIRNVGSYHLQVPAPPGLELRGIELLAELKEDGKTVRPHAHQWPTGAHIYFSNVTVTKAGPAVISLRAGRRGFISLAALTIFLITGLLWAFVHDAHAVNTDTERQVGAAVLLVVPAFLGIFVVRPGEHPLTARLLSGVRLLVLLCALLSVAAGAALAGVRPSDWGIPRTWHVYAILASVVSGAVTITWIASLTPVWEKTRRIREWQRGWGLAVWKYRALVVAAVGMLTACLLLLPVPSTAVGLERIGTFASLFAVSAFTAWLTFLAEASVKRDPSHPLRFVLELLAAAEMALAALVLIEPAREPLLDPVWADRRSILAAVWLLALGALAVPFRKREGTT